MSWEGVERKYVEIVSQQNPISFDFSQIAKNIISIDIDVFYYDQGSNPTVKMLGMVMANVRNHYNEVLHQNNCVLTIPAQSGVFNYNTTETDLATFSYGVGTSVELGFVSRDGGSLLNPQYLTPITFNNNYLMRMTFELEK